MLFDRLRLPSRTAIHCQGTIGLCRPCAPDRQPLDVLPAAMGPWLQDILRGGSTFRTACFSTAAVSDRRARTTGSRETNFLGGPPGVVAPLDPILPSPSPLPPPLLGRVRPLQVVDVRRALAETPSELGKQRLQASMLM
jgi:hypothetical protein